MDLALAVGVLSVLVALLAALYARQSRQTAESALVYQVLVNVLTEYRSAEMFVAIRSLWRFAREHKEDVAAAYKLQRLKDAAQIDGMDPLLRLDFERTTIHYQRRLVSQFYALLAGLHEQGLPHRKIIYSHWTEADLRIIPQVLVPTEETLLDALGSPMPPTLTRLKRLYDDCPHAIGK
jgi:hypothetical protein